MSIRLRDIERALVSAIPGLMEAEQAVLRCARFRESKQVYGIARQLFMALDYVRAARNLHNDPAPRPVHIEDVIASEGNCSIELHAYGVTLEECLYNATVSCIDQDGGEDWSKSYLDSEYDTEIEGIIKAALDTRDGKTT